VTPLHALRIPERTPAERPEKMSKKKEGQEAESPSRLKPSEKKIILLFPNRFTVRLTMSIQRARTPLVGHGLRSDALMF